MAARVGVFANLIAFESMRSGSFISGRKVFLLGVMLCIALILCASNFGDRGGPPFMAFFSLAGIVYLLAVREFFITPVFSRRVVVFGLILSALWQIEFLRVPAGVDDDVHRYVWDGRLQRLGYDPYTVIPSDPAATKLHTAETVNLNSRDLPSPYPAGAQLFFRAVTAVRESTFAFKTAFVICDFAIALLLLYLLRFMRRPEHLVLIYAWNPLLAIEAAGSGHIDIVVPLFLLVSAIALHRRWRTTAAIALGLAIAVKFLPIVLVPLYWRRVRIRDAAMAAAIVILLYLPFFHHGNIPTGSLGSYVQGFRFNGPLFALFRHFASAQLLVACAVLVGLVTAICLRRANVDCSPQSFAWPMAASLLCAPVVFPWYLLALLPFLTSTSTLAIIVWSVSIIPVYVMWHLRTLGLPWGPLPPWTMVVEYGCVAVAAAVVVLRRRPGRLQSSTGSTDLT